MRRTLSPPAEPTVTEPPIEPNAEEPRAIPVLRGCGTRIQGGIYLEIGVMQGFGLPLKEFILDPPVPVPAGLHVTPVGITMIEQKGADGTGTGIWHIVDWVGASHYPNVWDFLAEAQRFGISRRLSSQVDFNLITPASRLLIIHPHGIVENASALRQHGSAWKCPKGIAMHEPHLDPRPCCSGIWAQTVTGGETFVQTGQANLVDGSTCSGEDTNLVKRTHGSVTYLARAVESGSQARFTPAFIASFPVTRLTVVEGGNHDDNIRVASSARVPVHTVKQ